MRVVGADEMRDTTLVIQGSLREDTYKFYCSFYPDIPKIFYVSGDGYKGWRIKPNLHSSNDTVMHGRAGEAEDALVALGMVKTRFAIRLRGDEWYSNLCRVREEMEEGHKDRIYMVPVFLKKWEAWPYRMSDHMIAGSTENLSLMFVSYFSNLTSGNELYPSCWPLPKQSILAKGYVDRKIPDGNNPKEDFKSLFGTIDLEMLRFYKVCSDDGETAWYSNFNPHIRDVEQL